jgi:ribosomal protein S18 acetylase RimI-like enzyme
MDISFNRFSTQEVFNLLVESSSFFTPSLSKEIDLQTYAIKLSNFAGFLVCRKQGKIIGYIAYYKNIQARQIYIPLICVYPDFQHLGIGTQMLNKLEDTFKVGYHTLGLEVVKLNLKAYNFYIKHNFYTKEDRGKRYLMEKNIR